MVERGAPVIRQTLARATFISALTSAASAAASAAPFVPLEALSRLPLKPRIGKELQAFIAQRTSHGTVPATARYLGNLWEATPQMHR